MDHAHQLRITSHGKLRLFVAFALRFLQEHPNRPLILHTLPPDESAGRNARAKGSKLDPATGNIPRLITVVELIKREFASMTSKGLIGLAQEENPDIESASSITPVILLHQYNEIGYLEEGSSTDEPELPLELALQNKNFLKQAYTSYMKVTLCTQELPTLTQQGVTAQTPLQPPKRSRAAKTRERKRRNRAPSDQEMASNVEQMD